MSDAPANLTPPVTNGSPKKSASPLTRRRSVGRIYASRAIGRTRAWAREMVSPDRILAFFKTLLWVGPLTLLVWVYAELQQQVSLPNVTVPVEVQSTDPSKTARILQANEESVTSVLVTLRGPKAAVNRVSEMMKTSSPVPLRANFGDPLISTEGVGADRRFADAGVIVVGVQPGTLSVRVEPWLEREVRVQSRQADQYPGLTFEPATVRVKGPASLVEPPDGQRLVAYADVSGKIDPAAAAEREIVIDDIKVTLSREVPNMTSPLVRSLASGPLPAPGVSIVGSQTVKARLKPTGTEEWVIPTVLVRLAATDQLIREYEIAPVTPLFNVKVAGPKEKIAELRDPNAPAPRAFAELRSNAGPGDNEADLTWNFPPGITVKDAPKTVHVTLTKRQ